ncbi:hypothetical protein J7E87_22755 [Streptomyces sp. ISL-1]|uniref:hypothetical protein n=1 Tax=Streptomyces sp. ISL-1 TaxID=2817657 RepID=UPI001BEBF843|nr:hypothetical protein [Streptomyces sp. ISL-1]MBT2392172.1 hypothetical protein [Streptomyces sp. ISL-1]
MSLGTGEAAAEEGERTLRPLREVTEPLCDLSEVTAYTEAQRFLDEDYPNGRLYYWKSVNAPELSDKLIERLAEHAAAAPSPDSTIDLWYQGGAMARVGEEETAFANRGVPYLFGQRFVVPAIALPQELLTLFQEAGEVEVSSQVP